MHLSSTELAAAGSLQRVSKVTDIQTIASAQTAAGPVKSDKYGYLVACFSSGTRTLEHKHAGHSWWSSYDSVHDILQVQIGDKRWFKGAKKDAEGAWNSFVVA